MTKTPMWAIREGRTVYDNRWIRVREYQATAPTGAPALYGMVHMKNLALGVLPIDDEGCTTLVGQTRFTFGRYSWELPEGGGAVEADPLDGAKRELAEETGMQAASWLPLLADIHLSNSVTDERAYAWLAWGLSPVVAEEKDDSEELEIRRVPFGEAVRMATAGEITDVFTLVMLLKADHLARTGALPEPLAGLMLRGA
jgi:8-oxo-dGTP pyrophosphatase MutT (NUDIX family)